MGLDIYLINQFQLKKLKKNRVQDLIENNYENFKRKVKIQI